MTDNAPIFGEHNMEAHHLDPNRILPYFPWAELFAARNYELPYPAIIYSNEEAETLYQNIVDMLVAWIAEDQINIDVTLQFEGNPEKSEEAVGSLCIEVQLLNRPARLLNEFGLRESEIINLLRLATLDWVLDSENYGSEVKSEVLDETHWRLTAICRPHT